MAARNGATKKMGRFARRVAILIAQRRMMKSLEHMS
jgi:hypothetical protein